LPTPLSISSRTITSTSRGFRGSSDAPRVELGRDYRSTTFGSYVIFLRYADEGYITHVVHGARDMDAYFIQHSDDDQPGD